MEKNRREQIGEDQQPGGDRLRSICSTRAGDQNTETVFRRRSGATVWTKKPEVQLNGGKQTISVRGRKWAGLNSERNHSEKLR